MYEPIATFQYHFVSDTALKSNVTFGNLDLDASLFLGNVSTYVDEGGIVGVPDWALQVASSSWGSYPSNTTYDNDVAIIASAYDFIAVPPAYYTEIEQYLEGNNFQCVREMPTDDILCATDSSCDNVAPFLPTFSISFYDYN